eukprot:NODE_1160_length_980_cov_10.622509_g1115_i0.p1 GENE.NODE_1160_length_980_cov_10.622509_g1115_i0~~NODE_1160_length_980_cov_10.622509_g1115_i0.p1  ORF type:complete len:300 (-),score=24.03 NODE_1160_length_980_cov_10.622509_g1115_i0:33-932(-)
MSTLHNSHSDGQRVAELLRSLLSVRSGQAEPPADTQRHSPAPAAAATQNDALTRLLQHLSQTQPAGRNAVTPPQYSTAQPEVFNSAEFDPEREEGQDLDIFNFPPPPFEEPSTEGDSDSSPLSLCVVQAVCARGSEQYIYINTDAGADGTVISSVDVSTTSDSVPDVSVVSDLYSGLSAPPPCVQSLPISAPPHWVKGGLQSQVHQALAGIVQLSHVHNEEIGFTGALSATTGAGTRGRPQPNARDRVLQVSPSPTVPQYCVSIGISTPAPAFAPTPCLFFFFLQQMSVQQLLHPQANR